MSTRLRLRDDSDKAQLGRPGAVAVEAGPRGDVVAALFVFVVIAPRGLSLLVPTSPGTADALGVELSRRVAALPEVRSADTAFQSSWSSVTGRTEGLHIKTELRRWPADPEAIAKAAAQAIFDGDAPLTVNLPVKLTLHRGFTFGIGNFDYEESYRLGAQGLATEADD